MSCFFSFLTDPGFSLSPGQRGGEFGNMDMGNMDTDQSNMDSDDLVPSLQVFHHSAKLHTPPTLCVFVLFVW